MLKQLLIEPENWGQDSTEVCPNMINWQAFVNTFTNIRSGNFFTKVPDLHHELFYYLKKLLR
jgi:hypothetical protein